MKRTPLLRRTPMGRCKPIERKPMKAKPRPRKPKAVRDYLGYVAELGCIICRMPATVHHVTSDGLKRITRSDELVIGLCPRHHMIQHGPKDSIEALGHAGFEAVYNVHPLSEARRIRAAYLQGQSL